MAVLCSCRSKISLPFEPPGCCEMQLPDLFYPTKSMIRLGENLVGFRLCYCEEPRLIGRAGQL